MLTRRQLLSSGALASSLGALGLPHTAQASDERPWNLLVISSDEHNARFFGHRGHPVSTPNLDRLAGQGLSLDRVYTSSPICAPTRASFLTGLWPQEHQQLNNSSILDPGHYTMSSFFTELGYDTACFGKLHTNADESRESFGFRELLTSKSGQRWEEISKARSDNSAGPAWRDPVDEVTLTGPFRRMLGRVQPRIGQNRDHVLLEESRSWLEQDRDKPFFLYSSFLTPHYPFTLPEDFYHLYDPAKIELPDPVDLAELTARSPAAAASLARCGWSKADPKQSRTALARYMGCVSFLDHLVGELMDSLEASGQAERTLIVYASDHGDQAAEQGLWLKSVMFDGACRKPVILRMPGVLEAGSRSCAPVNEVDLLPTLAGLMGLGGQLPLAEISGRSQADLLLAEGGVEPGLEHLADLLPRQRAYSHLGFSHAQPWTSLVATERFKLTRTTDDTGRVTSRELYDLDEDPAERTSLADRGEYTALIEELEGGLDEHLAGLREPPFAHRKLSKEGPESVASL